MMWMMEGRRRSRRMRRQNGLEKVRVNESVREEDADVEADEVV